MLDELAVADLNGVIKSRIEHWNGTLPKFARHLRTWGEAGVVKTKDKMTAKLEDRGLCCMFVGYSLHHEGDVYRMWHGKTNRILH